MFRSARSLRCAALALVLAAFGLAIPASAWAAAASVVTVRASATGPVSGAASATRATITVTVTVTGAPTANTVLTAPVPGTVDLDALRVDGGAAPAGTASADPVDDPARTVLTVRLGAGASPLAGGVLTAGRHTVTIPTDLSRRAGTTIAPVTSTLTYLDATSGTTRATADVTIPLPDLVIAKPAGSEEDAVLPLAEGNEAFFLVQITSRNAAVNAATLTITVPRGLRVDSELGVVRVGEEKDVADLRCTTASNGTVRCPLGAVARPQFVAIALRSTGAAPVGSTGTFTVAVTAANGLDARPTDNTVQGTVRFVPATRLRVALIADHTRVEVGDKAHVTVSVRNDGAYPAAEIFGIIAAANSLRPGTSRLHFRVTGFTGRGANLIGNGSGTPIISGRAPREMTRMAGVFTRRLVARRAATQSAQIDVVLWNVGTLSAHASRREVLTLNAVSPGESTVIAVASSLQGASGCVVGGGNPLDCPEFDQLVLRAVASAGTDGNGADPIAATGVPTTRWASFALLLLVLGLLAQFVGARGRDISGRHRT